MQREPDGSLAGLDEGDERRSAGLAALRPDGDDDVSLPARFAQGTREIDPVRVATVRDHDEAVAQIVHDLKNPLATISLEAYLLDDKLARGEGLDARATLARIQHNISFLDRMVQDLLDSCSIAAGRLELRRVPTDLRTLLEQVVDRAVATRDRPRVFLEAPQSATVAVDDLRIERVVANLVVNALKYAPPSSGIVIRLESSAHGVRISVSDAGTGLTPGDMAIVFDKYRRASTGHAHQGEGLGLYVSRKIIEAHGGQIAVECVRGIGTRFFFDLPW